MNVFITDCKMVQLGSMGGIQAEFVLVKRKFIQDVGI